MSEPALSPADQLALAQLVDQQAIIDTAIRYTWALDSNEWDMLDDVFVPDATTNFMRAEVEAGLPAIKERVRSALGPLDDSQHIVSNHQVVIDGDTATHRCYLHAQHIREAAEGGALFVVAGRYEDEFVRTPAGWRIKHRSLIRMWTDGNPAVVRRS